MYLTQYIHPKFSILFHMKTCHPLCLLHDRSLLTSLEVLNIWALTVIDNNLTAHDLKSRLYNIQQTTSHHQVTAESKTSCCSKPGQSVDQTSLSQTLEEVLPEKYITHVHHCHHPSSSIAHLPSLPSQISSRFCRSCLFLATTGK